MSAARAPARAALVFAAPRLVTAVSVRPRPLPSLFRRLTGDLCDEINADQKRSCAVSARSRLRTCIRDGVLYET